MTRALGRGGAAAIALLALLDPSVPRAQPARLPVELVVVPQRTFADDAEASSRGRRAAAAVAALEAALERDYDVRRLDVSTASDATACARADACVIVSDGAIPARVAGAGTLAGIVRIDAGERPSIAITGVTIPPMLHAQAAATAAVRLRGVGVSGRTTIQLRDGGSLVGESAHDWSPEAATDGEDVVVTVPWLPAGSGLRRVRIAASVSAGEETPADNHADLGVVVSRTPSLVLLHEPEPTWNGTFVRRALEHDARFRIGGRTRLSPAIAVARGASPQLSDDALRAASAVVLSAPHLTSAADVERLERYVRVSGGTVVLLAEQPLSGPVVRLAGQAGVLHAEPAGINAGPLRVKRLVAFDATQPGVTTLVAAGPRALVIDRRSGRGRIIVSGAVDAWTARGPDFDAVWTSLVAGALAPATDTVHLHLDRTWVGPMDRVTITAEARGEDAALATLPARGTVTCGDETSPVRLWPAARSGTFSATFDAPAGDGICSVDVTIGAAQATASVLVSRDFRPPVAAGDALDALAQAHDAVIVSAGEEARVAARVRERHPVPMVDVASFPMRSAWWIVPFVALLAVAWRSSSAFSRQ